MTTLLIIVPRVNQPPFTRRISTEGFYLAVEQ